MNFPTVLILVVGFLLTSGCIYYSATGITKKSFVRLMLGWIGALAGVVATTLAVLWYNGVHP